MLQSLSRLLGVPFTAEGRARSFDNAMGRRDGADAVNFIFQGVAHNTGKAGALLAAQGMFVVVATYALDHGWVSALVRPALVLLLVGALFATSILRSTGGVFEPSSAKDPAHRMFDLLLSRMLRFNLALYMSCLAVILLLIATLVMA